MRTAFIILALAFTFQDSPPPLDRSKQQESASKKHDSTTPSPAPSTVTIINNQSGSGQQGNKARAESEQRPQKPPWWDVAWSTWGLVGVGVVAAYVALRTLSDIKKQTRNTSVTAKAALKNAEAVVSAERAWIMVVLEKVPGVGFRNTGHNAQRQYTMVRFRLKCINVGKTIAWIDEQSACLEIIARPSTQPDFSKLQILSNEPQWIESGGNRYLDATIEGTGHEEIALMSIIWGLVKYRDAFGEHTTTFGFCILPDTRLERLSGYPAYNNPK